MKLRLLLSVVFLHFVSLALAQQAGSRDQTFNPNGSGGNFQVFCIALQNDGKIILGSGNVNMEYNGVSVEDVVRLNPDGTLDNSLNIGTGFTGGTEIRDIVVQPDGKIIVGGFFDEINGTSAKGVVRLNSDGSLDPGFELRTAWSAYYIHELALLNDGSILVAGQIVTPPPILLWGGIIKLNSDGSLDSSFNSGGEGAMNNHIHALAVQPDGKILIGGVFETYNGIPANLIARLNADGTLDPSFNTGSGIDGVLPDVEAITIQTDGKILVGGKFEDYNGTPVRGIIRLNNDGTLDNNFFTGGFTSSVTVRAIKVQSDGKIIIGGTFNSYDGTQVIGHARLHPDGTLDRGFDTTVWNSNIRDVEIDANGKILVGGPECIYRMLGEGTASIESIEQISLSVYPNPSQGNLNIAGHKPTPAPVLLEFRSLMGQLVFSEQFNSGKGNFKLSVSLPKELPPGN